MPLDRQLSAFQRDVNNISHVMYGNLPAEERFRLIVQSQAANNHAEVRRLIDTSIPAPRRPTSSGTRRSWTGWSGWTPGY
jgi:hypothetical protein